MSTIKLQQMHGQSEQESEVSTAGQDAVRVVPNPQIAVPDSERQYHESYTLDCSAL